MSVNTRNFKFVYNFDWNVAKVEFAVAYLLLFLGLFFIQDNNVAVMLTLFY